VKRLLNPSLALLQKDETGIANTTLVPFGRKPIADDGVRARFDESILVPFGASDWCV
jgi:hypothetical protein